MKMMLLDLLSLSKSHPKRNKNFYKLELANISYSCHGKSYYKNTKGGENLKSNFNHSVENFPKMTENSYDCCGKDSNINNYDAEQYRAKTAMNVKYSTNFGECGERIVDSLCRADFYNSHSDDGDGGGFVALEMVQCAVVDTSWLQNQHQKKQHAVNKILDNNNECQCKAKFCVSPNTQEPALEVLRINDGDSEKLTAIVTFQSESYFELKACSVARTNPKNLLIQQLPPHRENSEKISAGAIQRGAEKFHNIRELSPPSKIEVAFRLNAIQTSSLHSVSPSIEDTYSPLAPPTPNSADDTTETRTTGKVDTFSNVSKFYKERSRSADIKYKGVQLGTQSVQDKDFANFLVSPANEKFTHAIAIRDYFAKDIKNIRSYNIELYLIEKSASTFNCVSYCVEKFQNYAGIKKQIDFEIKSACSKLVLHNFESEFKQKSVVFVVAGISRYCLYTNIKYRISNKKVRNFIKPSVGISQQNKINECDEKKTKKSEQSFLNDRSRTPPQPNLLGYGGQYVRVEENLISKLCGNDAVLKLVVAGYNRISTNLQKRQRIHTSKDSLVLLLQQKEILKISISNAKLQFELIPVQNELKQSCERSTFFSNTTLFPRTNTGNLDRKALCRIQYEEKILVLANSIQLKPIAVEFYKYIWQLISAILLNEETSTNLNFRDKYFRATQKAQYYNEQPKWFLKIADENEGKHCNIADDINDYNSDIISKTRKNRKDLIFSSLPAHTDKLEVHKRGNEKESVQVALSTDSIKFKCNLHSARNSISLLPPLLAPTSSSDEEVNELFDIPYATGAKAQLPNNCSGEFEASQRLRRLQQHFRGRVCMSRVYSSQLDLATTKHSNIDEDNLCNCSGSTIRIFDESLKTESQPLKTSSISSLRALPEIAKNATNYKCLAAKKRKIQKEDNSKELEKINTEKRRRKRLESQIYDNIDIDNYSFVPTRITPIAIPSSKKVTVNVTAIKRRKLRNEKKIQSKERKNTKQAHCTFHYEQNKRVCPAEKRASEIRKNFYSQKYFSIYSPERNERNRIKDIPLKPNSSDKLHNLYTSKIPVKLSNSTSTAHKLLYWKPQNFGYSGESILPNSEIPQHPLDKKLSEKRQNTNYLLSNSSIALQHIVKAEHVVADNSSEINKKKTLESEKLKRITEITTPRKSAFIHTRPNEYNTNNTLFEKFPSFNRSSSFFPSEFHVSRLSEFCQANCPSAGNTLRSYILDSNHHLTKDNTVLRTNAKSGEHLNFQCYDELFEELTQNSSSKSVESSKCICNSSLREASATRIKSVRNSNYSALLDTTTPYKMRELNGQLRGLLKKPNRPPPTRKNRVVFDETRNEFFEADYIILIREDCAYDEEDEEPCTCGEHELVRLCCEEGCQCNYSATSADDNRTSQSSKYTPPNDFADDAALSPPDGYKDSSLKNTLGGALSGHIFGAQHLQQLQVIQRLQQQRAAMLAARNTNQIPPPPPPVTSASINQHHQQQLQQQHQLQNNSVAQQQHSPEEEMQGVCTECAECAECAAKQLKDAECSSIQCKEELAPLGVPAVALLPLHASSPERRITQKEIIAGEERPKYVLQTQYKPSPAKSKKDKLITVEAKNQRYLVETITTMTTVTERRIVREATEDVAAANTIKLNAANDTPTPATLAVKLSASGGSPSNEEDDKPPPIPAKESSPTQINGILKGGKLWKQDSGTQSDDQNNTTSEDEGGSSKRSVRFVTEDSDSNELESGAKSATSDVDDGENQINELIPIKKHSTLFNNALRPNSAVRQLFPSVAHHAPVLTSEALRAFDESKRAGCLVPHLPGSGDSDTIRRSMERNILRRSLIKKKAVKANISLEDRIKQLTCDIDEGMEEGALENGDEDIIRSDEAEELKHRDSPSGDENPQKVTNGNVDKNFSPSSSVSSSSSGSSAYKKISDIFNRDKKQEKIIELEENPIVIIPQECRCPAAPDLGIGMQVPVVHTQIHRTPPRQSEPKRQFLSTLAPLTACVVGNKDDLSSYYTLAATQHGGHAGSNAHFAELSSTSSTLNICENSEEVRKVAPDVIAGTPGQEQQDELVVFAQQEANRTEKIKKRYTNDTSNASSDDDEQNDYGFNKRPSVRGIKPKFSSTNEILQQMQEQLQQQMPSIAVGQPINAAVKSFTLPKQSSTTTMSKQISHNTSPQNLPHSSMVTIQQPQPQQVTQIATNAAVAQQQTEQRTWSFYAAEASDQQALPADSGLQQAYYQTLPVGSMFRQTMVQHGQDESLMYAQNCHSVTTLGQQHYGHYARSPTRRPESPPPLRNYHQTMVLIPYNAETYSQFAASSIDPKVAHIQRQNILEYQQVTQQTIRVPIGYTLPGMQLHVVAGRGHAAHYATAQHPQQRIMTQRYELATDGSNIGTNFAERGVPEGASAVAHTDCISNNGNVIGPIINAQTQPTQNQQSQPSSCTHSSNGVNIANGQQDSVYYAMNV